MEKGRAKPHLQRPVESVKVPEFEMDFCYLLQDPKRRHEPDNRGVHGASWRKVVQNLICSDQWRARRFLSWKWISAT